MKEKFLTLSCARSKFFFGSSILAFCFIAVFRPFHCSSAAAQLLLCIDGIITTRLCLRCNTITVPILIMKDHSNFLICTGCHADSLPCTHSGSVPDFCLPRVLVQGSGNKKWNGAGGLVLILDKSLEHCNRTALLQKICCNGEVSLKPHPLP